jgi:hypothetical protein
MSDAILVDLHTRQKSCLYIPRSFELSPKNIISEVTTLNDDLSDPGT